MKYYTKEPQKTEQARTEMRGSQLAYNGSKDTLAKGQYKDGEGEGWASLREIRRLGRGNGTK